MFCSDIGVIQGFCFFDGQSEDLLDTRRIRNVSDHLLVRSSADLFFHFHAHGFQIESKLLKHIDGDPLAELDQAEQQVLGADKGMVKAIGFLPREREHLLSARGEIIHGLFFAHSSKCLYFCGLSNPVGGVAGGFAIGRLTGRKRSRTMSARSKSRSSAESFSVCCFCRWAGWVKMNNSSTKDRSTPGKRPTSTPSLINERRFMVSFEETLWALARIP